jgi:hypothetical protein
VGTVLQPENLYQPPFLIHPGTRRPSSHPSCMTCGIRSAHC